MAGTLHVQLLGDFRILYNDRLVTSVNSPRLQSLLAYILLYHHTPQSRQYLAFLFWPDSSESQARTNLRKLLLQLRRALPDADHFIEITSRTVQWRGDVDYFLDVDVLRRQLSRIALARKSDNKDRLRRHLAMLADLYTGDLLPSCYESWIEPIRLELRQTVIDALNQLVELSEEREEYQTAIRYGRRLLTFDPLNEDVYRRLMTLHGLSGDRAGALDVYRTCVKVLHDELGVEPGPEIQEIYRQLQDAKTFLMYNNLPAETTPFVGRSRPLRDVHRLLSRPDCRLLTIMGPGGMGKTRLAIRVGHQLLESFSHGVCFVSLGSVVGRQLAPKITSALQFSFRSQDAPREQLLSYLQDREMLLILDNFEHLVAEAPLITDILERAPGVKVLVTSQTRLNLQEEWLFPLQGMRTPHMGFPRTSTESIDQYSAVQLFLQCARRVKANFLVTDEDLTAILRICNALGGLPLGVELAAAWVHVLSCQEIADEIERNLDFLVTLNRNVEPRHRSLRAAFEHTWQHLSSHEQRVFKNLCIFRGGFRRDAGRDISDSQLSVLVSLLDKSLIRRTELGRYEIHELLRQFGEEKLRADPAEYESIQQAHANYYCTFVRQREADVRDKRALDALREMEDEIENIEAAWMWSVAHSNLQNLNLAAEGLGQFYETRSRFHEGDELFGAAWTATKKLFTAPSAQSASIQQIACKLESRYARFRFLLGEYTTAQELLQGSLTRAETFGLDGEMASCLVHLAEIARLLDKYMDAKRLGEAGLAIYRRLDDQEGVAQALNGLGVVAHNLGNYSEARALYHDSYLIRKTMDNPFGVAQVVGNLGRVTHAQGQYHEAAAYYEESLAIRRKLGDKEGEAYILNSLGSMESELGRYQEAQAKCRQSLEIFRSIGYRRGIAISLSHLGDIERNLGNFQRSIQLFREAHQIYVDIGSQLGIGMAMIYLARAAIAQEDWEQARQMCAKALEMCSRVGYRWGEGFTHSLVGQIEFRQGNYEQAQQRLLQAFQIAAEIDAKPLVMAVRVGVAMLLIQAGKCETAVELLTRIANHGSTTQEDKQRSQRLLSELAAELPAEIFESAQSRGQIIMPDSTMVEFDFLR